MPVGRVPGEFDLFRGPSVGQSAVARLTETVEIGTGGRQKFLQRIP
jgi:hypothetical protein